MNSRTKCASLNKVKSVTLQLWTQKDQNQLFRDWGFRRLEQWAASWQINGLFRLCSSNTLSSRRQGTNMKPTDSQYWITWRGSGRPLKLHWTQKNVLNREVTLRTPCLLSTTTYGSREVTNRASARREQFISVAGVSNPFPFVCAWAKRARAYIYMVG